MSIFGWKLPNLDPLTILSIIAFAIAGGIIGWLFSGSLI